MSSASGSGSRAMVGSTHTSMPWSSSQVGEIPLLLYGTAWKGEATTSLTLQAFAAGFRGVDVAGQRKHYREDLVGEAVHAAKEELGIERSHLWLQSKFTPVSGQDLTGPVPYDQDARPRDAVLSSFRASLRKLHKGDRWSFRDDDEDDDDGKGKQRAWLDSYLLHSPLNTLEETLEAWGAMEELVERGQVRMIGYSNVYDARILEALRKSARRYKPRIIQNRWHHTSGHDVSLLSSFSPALSPNDNAADQAGIVYQPFWTLTGNPRLLRSDAVNDAASKHSWTASQVVYSFVAQGFGIPGLRCTVLSGTTDIQHMHEAVEAVSGDGRLTEEEVEQIRRIIYGE